MSNSFIDRCCNDILFNSLEEFENGFGDINRWGYSDIITREMEADKEKNVFKREPSFAAFKKVAPHKPECVIYGKEGSVCKEFISLSMEKSEYSNFFIIAEKNSKFKLFINSENVKNRKFVFIVSIEEGSEVEIVSLNSNTESVDSFIYANQSSKSIFKAFNISCGVKKGNNYLKSLMNSKDVDTHFYGVSFVDAHEQVNNYSIMGHFVEQCQSSQHYKSVIVPEGKSLFEGTVYVEKDAQKTKAFQQSNNILLGDGAKARNLLQLQIYADDVRCSHGSTTGELDAEALFYMRQRGIEIEEAKKLQIIGFLGDIILKINSEELSAELLNKVTQKLLEGNTLQ